MNREYEVRKDDEKKRQQESETEESDTGM